MQLHNETRAKLQLWLICDGVFCELPPCLHSVTWQDFFTMVSPLSGSDPCCRNHLPFCGVLCLCRWADVPWGMRNVSTSTLADGSSAGGAVLLQPLQSCRLSVTLRSWSLPKLWEEEGDAGKVWWQQGVFIFWTMRIWECLCSDVSQRWLNVGLHGCIFIFWKKWETSLPNHRCFSEANFSVLPVL